LKRKPIQNLAASVHARLLRRTELGNEDFQFVLMRYGVERLMDNADKHVAVPG
jgi:hypothetical protein